MSRPVLRTISWAWRFISVIPGGDQELKVSLGNLTLWPKKTHFLGWRDGSVVKSECAFPEDSSLAPHPRRVAQNSSSMVFNPAL